MTTRPGTPLGVRSIARVLLGGLLLLAGIGHLSWARTSFLAQVPDWVPGDPDAIVVASGVVEILLGTALIGARTRRMEVGWVAAAFFVAVFLGNISQFVSHKSAFGLNSDVARGVRLLFQPLLVFWALRSTSPPVKRLTRHLRRDHPDVVG